MLAAFFRNSVRFITFFALAAASACAATTAGDVPATSSGPTTPAPAAPIPPPKDAPGSGSSSQSAPDGGDAPTDAGAPDAAVCGYEAEEQWVVDCANVPKKVTELTSKSCAKAYALGGAQYTSLAEALAAQACNASCVRKAFQAVMLLRCGKKTEYITYRAEGCSDVIDTPDGMFRTVEEWNAAKPCP
jgi:hypothetical protein